MKRALTKEGDYECNLPAPRFLDVKAILEWLVKGKKHLLSVHGNDFSWKDRGALLDATVKLGSPQLSFRLISPELIGNGKGDKTNLVVALRDEDGVEEFGQMPKGGNDEGRTATPLQIATIVAWIDAGCPE